MKKTIAYPFDCVIVGSGIFGSVLAERLANMNNDIKILIIEKRKHIGGNCHSEIDPETNIEYHTFGTHIFHTSNKKVWDYINTFVDFNGYHHQVLTTYRDKVYQMPINLETINSFYHLNLKPFEVDDFLYQEISKENIQDPENFEEKAVSLVGRPLYEAFIRGYTIKQWQKNPRDLPASILQRLPFRKNYNENYFHDKWQGIPEQGYAHLFSTMLAKKNITIQLETDFFAIRDQIPDGVPIIYTGPVDRFFDYKFGRLEWRTLRFEREVLDVEDYQGTSVMNYAEEQVPFTRIHEPRHLHPERCYSTKKTLIIKEFSLHDEGKDPYYPVNDSKNQKIFALYQEETKKYPHVIFAGRLGQYKYLDMDQAIALALELFATKLTPMYQY